MKKTMLKKWCASAVMLAMVSAAAVPVSAADLVAVLLDDSADIAALEAGTAPNTGGWYKTATSSSNTLTLSNSVTTADVQAMPTVQSGKIWLNKSASGIQMYKQWSGSTIYFGEDGKYHISWKQYMPNSESYNGSWGRGSYLALVRGYGTKVLESIRIGFDDAYVASGNNTNSDYYPAIYYSGSNDSTPSGSASNTIWSDTPVTKGVFYVCDAYITTKASGNDTIEFKCRPYGESEEKAITLTKEFSNGNKYQAIRIYNYSVKSASEKMGAADIKVEKIYDSANNYESLRAEMSSFNPDFSEIFSQEDIDSEMSKADSMNGTLTWSSNDESKIAVTGGKPTLQSDASGELCLTAKLAIGNVYVEKSFPVTILKQQEPSKNILSDDFSGMDGIKLSEAAAEQAKGWASGYTQINGSLADSEIASTAYGNVIDVKAVCPDENTNPVAEFTRKLVSGIDFDTDRTYYITWNQMMDGYGYSDTYKSQRIQLRGDSLKVDGSGDNVEISPMFNTLTALTDSTVSNNNFDGDYYPARLYLKYGAKNNYPSVTQFVAQKGRMYTFAVRIDASADGNDTIYVKAYPTGTPAVTSWQLSTDVSNKTAKITGTADTIGFFAQPVSEDSAIMYGNIKIDSISTYDAKKYMAAEELIKTGSKSDATDAVNNLIDGAWKSELLLEAEAMNKLTAGAVTFLQNTTELFKIEDSEETEQKICNVMTAKLIPNEDITAKITVTNNTDSEKECIAVAAMYDDKGALVNVGLSESEAVSAKGSKNLSAELKYAENGTGVKLFIFNNFEEIKPVNSVIVLDSDGLTQ